MEFLSKPLRLGEIQTYYVDQISFPLSLSSYVSHESSTWL